MLEIISNEDWTVVFPGLVLFVGFWAVAIYASTLKHRRRKSHRQDRDGIHYWVEIDGSPRQSRADPREKWDAEDAAERDRA